MGPKNSLTKEELFAAAPRIAREKEIGDPTARLWRTGLAPPRSRFLQALDSMDGVRKEACAAAVCVHDREAAFRALIGGQAGTFTGQTSEVPDA